MRSNKWDSFIGITTFGESHGPAIGVVLEDIKPGIDFPFKRIQQELNKRRPINGSYSSLRKEEDRIKVISGVLEGKTTGMPICILVDNTDFKTADYEKIKNIFRPGHGDYSFFKKFKIYDYRGGGRISGRETISRVAASAVVSELIKPIEIKVYPVQIGEICVSEIDHNFSNELSWPDKITFPHLIAYLDAIKTEGNSVGGIVECSIVKIPAGLGDPVFEKLDANLAKAVISIGSVKGIEFGDGFKAAAAKGSENNDQISNSGFITNHSGGILGGISTGQEIKFRFVVKPTPSIKLKQSTINSKNEKVELKLEGRFDTCIIPRILPIAKAMVTLVLADAVSYQKLVSGDELNLYDYREALDKIDEDILIALKRRLKISELIGAFKKSNQLPVNDLNREQELLENLNKKADQLGLKRSSVQQIWKLLISDSKEIQ